MMQTREDLVPLPGEIFPRFDKEDFGWWLTAAVEEDEEEVESAKESRLRR